MYGNRGTIFRAFTAGSPFQYQIAETRGCFFGIGPALSDFLEGQLACSGGILLLPFRSLLDQTVEYLLVDLEGSSLAAHSSDPDLLDPVSLADGIDDLLSFNDPAEDGVKSVEPGGGFVGDEKLAAVGAGAAVGHAESPRSGVFQIGIQLVGKAVSRASRTVA